MSRNFLRPFSVAVSTVICASAQAAPAIIDSEQRAAAAVLSAHHFLIDRNELSNARQLLIDLTAGIRRAFRAS